MKEAEINKLYELIARHIHGSVTPLEPTISPTLLSMFEYQDMAMLPERGIRLRKEGRGLGVRG